MTAESGMGSRYVMNWRRFMGFLSWGDRAALATVPPSEEPGSLTFDKLHNLNFSRPVLGLLLV